MRHHDISLGWNRFRSKTGPDFPPLFLRVQLPHWQSSQWCPKCQNVNREVIMAKGQAILMYQARGYVPRLTGTVVKRELKMLNIIFTKDKKEATFSSFFELQIKIRTYVTTKGTGENFFLTQDNTYLFHIEKHDIERPPPPPPGQGFDTRVLYYDSIITYVLYEINQQ